MRDEWQWQWRDDPQLETEGHVGAVAECGTDIVASTALRPAGLVVAGAPVRAWWSGDTMVHPEHRRRGLAERLFHGLFEQHPGEPILGKGISAPALPMLVKCGFALHDTGGHHRRTLSFAPSLARRIGPLAARALAAIGDRLLPRLRTVPGSESNLGDFDARFDELWRDAGPTHRTIARRDAAFLNWRYRRHPFRTYQVLTHVVDERLYGYAVWTTFRRRGTLRARIADLFTRRDDEGTRSALLAATLLSAHSAGADRIDCFATDVELQRALRAAGFRAAAGEPLAVHGLDLDGLYVTAGDGDGT
jgi:GNAT superfamily N-acetyltransferase